MKIYFITNKRFNNFKKILNTDFKYNNYIFEKKINCLNKINNYSIIILPYNKKYIKLTNKIDSFFIYYYNKLNIEDENLLLKNQFEYIITPDDNIEYTENIKKNILERLEIIISKIDKVKNIKQRLDKYISDSFHMITNEKKLEKAIEKLNEANNEIIYLAYHDSLTGLYNRKKFYEIANNQIIQADRNNMFFALLFLDLDNFKNINDNLGHNAGDLLLQLVAERLRNTVRKSDYIFRFGGDEFIIILNNIKDEFSICQVSEKILTNISSFYKLKGNELNVTASVGICLYPRDGIELEELLSNSDKAMYHAKSYKNKFAFYSEDLNKITLNKYLINHQLKNSINKNSIKILYNPFFYNNDIIYVDIIFNMELYKNKIVCLSDLESILEKTDLAVKIGKQLFYGICEEILNKDNLIESYCFEIFIKISKKQLLNNDFIDMLNTVIKKYKKNKKRIVLELNENVFIDENKNVRININKLVNIGFLISVTSFGKSFIMLNIIKNIKIKYLKIDSSLTNNLDNIFNLTLLKSILDLAKIMKIIPIITDVNSKKSLISIENEGSNFIQGNYLLKPVDIIAFRKYIKNK